MEKKGQFFLIAALVIIALILGLVTVRNVARSSSEDVTLYDFSREFSYEGSQVIDQGIYTLLPEESIYGNTKFLGKLYYDTQDEDTEFFIIYGNNNVAYYSCTGDTETCLGSACETTCTRKVEDTGRPIVDQNARKIAV